MLINMEIIVYIVSLQRKKERKKEKERNPPNQQF